MPQELETQRRFAGFIDECLNVLRQVAKQFCVPERFILNPKLRTKNVSRARHAYFYLLHKRLNLSYKEIAVMFGAATSTVKSACYRFNKRMAQDNR